MGGARRGPIRYDHGDLTSTRFERDSFDVTVRLSVIDHGVDTEAYVREMSRLLRPSGILNTSTDYWVDPIDTRGQVAYGVPVKIFKRLDVEAMLTAAQGYGLWATGEIDLNCNEKAVTWDRVDLKFTFTCFALEKRGSDINVASIDHCTDR